MTMQRIPFPLESYNHQSKPLSSKFLLNLMAEQEPADARVTAALVSTPGLVDSGWAFGAGPVTAMNYDMPGVLYAVSGTHFYRLTHPVGYSHHDRGSGRRRPRRRAIMSGLMT